MQIPKRTRLEVNLDILYENAKALKKLAGDSDVMAVLKADGYSHGAIMTAREMLRGGINRFAVACLSEAVSLRDGGISGELLVLGYTDPSYINELISGDISQTVVDGEHAAALSKAAVNANGTLNIHIKIDSGMNRIGIDWARPDVIDIIREISELPGLRITGAFTHLSSADMDDEQSEEFTRYQISEFKRVTDAAKAAGISLGTLHAANSAGTLRFKESYFDMIRPGSLVFGLDPMPSEYKTEMPVRPAVSMRAIIEMVKELPAGRYVGYSRTYRSQEPVRIATAAFGYADGYPRGLSNKGIVIAGGEYARVAGRVCMDQTMIDISGIDGIRPGDELIIIGEDGGKRVTLTETAELCDSMYLEVLTRIGRRVPVYYTKAGETVAVLDYMTGGLKIL